MINSYDATQEIFTFTKAAITAVLFPTAYNPNLVFWEDVEKGAPLPTTAMWQRVTYENVIQEEATLWVNPPDGSRRYHTRGLLVVACFAPKALTAAGDNLRKFSEDLRKKYLGQETAGGVKFSSVRVVGTAPDSTFYQRRLLAEVQFDEIQKRS